MNLAEKERQSCIFVVRVWWSLVFLVFFFKKNSIWESVQIELKPVMTDFSNFQLALRFFDQFLARPVMGSSKPTWCLVPGRTVPIGPYRSILSDFDYLGVWRMKLRVIV